MAVEMDIQQRVERGGSLEEGIQGGFGGEVGDGEEEVWGEVQEGHFFSIVPNTIRLENAEYIVCLL